MIYSTACGTIILDGKINKTNVKMLEILTSSAGYYNQLLSQLYPNKMRPFGLNSIESS